MTLEEATADLGWGLHDALLQGLEIDWTTAILRLIVRIKADENQTLDRLASVSIGGLQYCIIDPPGTIDEIRGRGLWMDDGAGVAPSAQYTPPPTPDGCFAHWLFIHGWNSFIQIGGRTASLEWLEAEPQPVDRRALRWPGSRVKRFPIPSRSWFSKRSPGNFQRS